MAQDSSKAEFWDTRYDTHVTPWEAGRAPAELVRFTRGLPNGSRILVPGCGSGHDVRHIADAGFDVLAIDFSEAAVTIARQVAGQFADRIRLADFFEFDTGAQFDVVYERAFLCALPRRLWDDYARRVASIIRPGGLLVGFWFLDDNERGPPFGTSEAGLHELLDARFALESNEPVSESIPVFQGKERWQAWRRR